VSTSVLEGGEGAPIVLLHGPGGCAAHWMRVIPDLATTHRVIAPDLPGQGASNVDGAKLDAKLDAGRVTAWLGELIDATCTAPPMLIGQTLGGAIAATFASGDPTRISGLVLVDSLGLRPFEPAPEFGHALEGFLSRPDNTSHDRLWKYCAFDLDGLRGEMADTWAAFTEYNVDRARTPSVQSALYAMMESFGFPAIEGDVLERITVPTALVWGRHDLATPLSVAEEASARYGWPLRVIEGSADDPAIEQPEAFMRVLRGVLEATSRGSVAS
jgi:pimeloyl-ACP methyl ester carboxylesterase